jgi:outer membrane protein TolC
MPAISLPLFTGGRLEGNLKQKIALFNEAVYNYNNGLLEAVKEVSSAIFELKAFYDQTQVQKKVVENRLDKQNLTQERVEKGLDTQLNFYYTLIETLEENIQKAKLENFRYAALVRLIKSLGGGFETQELPELVKGGK